MVTRVSINPKVMRECREQLNLDIDDIKKKIPFIAEIESGTKNPTLKQLDNLAKLYEVPSWVFISESLPEQYKFSNKIPAFRQFAQNTTDDSHIFDSSKKSLM